MKKEYPDDDGRVIADMEDLDSLSVVSGLFGFRRTDEMSRSEKKRIREQAREERRNAPVTEPAEMSKEDRRAFTFGALKAVLLIASAYIAGFGILILILFLVWGLF